MKNTTTQITVVILSLVLGGVIPSETKASQLNLRMFNDSRFTMILDGQKIARSTYKVNLNELSPGEHHIRIIKFKRSRYDGRRTKHIIFDDYVFIPNRRRIRAVVHPRRGLKFVSVTRLRRTFEYESQYNNGFSCSASGYEEEEFTQNFWFEDLKATILNTSFESDKFRIAKQAMLNRSLSSNQVADLMSCFSFESTRLKFAKLAYDKTFDPENFYIINNAFHFSSSVDDLYHYIGSF